MSAPAPRVEVGVVLAFSWALVAVTITLLLGSRLGLRGWVWLGLHHVLCAVGVSHQLHHAWLRRKEKKHV